LVLIRSISAKMLFWKKELEFHF